MLQSFASSPPDTQTGRAALSARFLAFLLDLIIVFVMTMIPWVGAIMGVFYWLLRDGLPFDFMDHRSIGKTVLKIRPIGRHGERVSVPASVRRNWILAIGALPWVLDLLPFIKKTLLPWLLLLCVVLLIIEGILVLISRDRRRLGDRLAQTCVVRSKE